jgi:hypothetical protein
MMGKDKINRILSGNYKDVGFKRGFDQAVGDKPISHIHRTDINPVNWVFRHKDADETYDAGVHEGYDAGLRKKHGVYDRSHISHGNKYEKGGATMQGYSYHGQMNLLNALIDNQQDLKGFFGTIRDGHGQNIDSSERLGLEQDYMAGLRERQSRLNLTMDHLESLIDKHLKTLNDEHREAIQRAIDSLSD